MFNELCGEHTVVNVINGCGDCPFAVRIKNGEDRKCFFLNKSIPKDKKIGSHVFIKCPLGISFKRNNKEITFNLHSYTYRGFLDEEG